MLKNYIFDFGDVFINLDKAATTRELKKLGAKRFTQAMQSANNQYEKGLISTRDFLQFYQTQIPNTSQSQLAAAWNSIILDFPEYRLQFLEKFASSHRCFLLSNINDLHLKLIKQQLDTSFYNRFVNCFEKVYYSHEVHFRKPNADIFEYVLNDANIIANETLFVDDTYENIEAAKELGLQVWHLQSNEDVVMLLDKNY